MAATITIPNNRKFTRVTCGLATLGERRERNLWMKEEPLQGRERVWPGAHMERGPELTPTWSCVA